MNPYHALRATFAALLLAAITGCALMNRPAPLTTLQLRLPRAAHDAEFTWPEGVALVSLTSTSVISGNRVMVFDGAKVMQFNGLRWVDTPEAMLTEQFKLMQARREANRQVQHFAFLQLALVDFSIHLNGDGDKTVLVSANAELQCAANGSVQALGILSSEQPLQKMDDQSVAATFTNATETTAKAMLSAAKLALQRCPAAKYD